MAKSAKVNLSKMSLEELKTLQKDVVKAIVNFEKRKREEALSALNAKAKELGFTLSDLTGSSKATKSVIPPKYRPPENPALTWSGRGRKPKWLVEAIEAEHSPDDFAIDK